MDRKAYVRVKNDTGKTLRVVSVLHKYSDDYRNHKSWTNIHDDAYTKPDLTVHYNTGFLTTGKDWWLVTWEFKGGKRVHFTDPNNFQGFMHFLENVGRIAIPAALAAAAAAETAGTTVVAGATAASTITNMVLNNEDMTGMKQHILREEDAHHHLTIHLRKDGSVEFVSPSGTSETNSSSTNGKDEKTLKK